MRFALPLAFAVVLVAPGAPAQNLEGELKDVEWIGFQQFQEASRVFVRTTEPVKYRVDASKQNEVVIILENARIPTRNNRRPLDTHYFDGPVTYIQSRVVEAP